VTRYRWVAARKAEGFPITMAAKVAGVSRQAFGDWRARQAAGPRDAERAEAELVAEIREIHDEFDGTYGEPRIPAELARRGRRANHKRVERLMRAHGIAGVHKPPKMRTTIPAHDAAPLPDLIGRGFDPGAPDVAWVGDITYIPTDQGWLYLASVLDLGSRRLLGYSMADHMRTELVADALHMAAGARGGVTDGIIFHGDRGSQYLSGDYRQLVADLGMIQSVGRTGVCLLTGQLGLQLTVW
jgi:transposase InsO family protein